MREVSSRSRGAITTNVRFMVQGPLGIERRHSLAKHGHKKKLDLFLHRDSNQCIAKASLVIHICTIHTSTRDSSKVTLSLIVSLK